jgi:hypothetical protein
MDHFKEYVLHLIDMFELDFTGAGFSEADKLALAERVAKALSAYDVQMETTPPLMEGLRLLAPKKTLILTGEGDYVNRFPTHGY